MRVLGVDPGLQKTGIGIVEVSDNKLIPIFFETVFLKPKKDRALRLLEIHQAVLRVIREFRPTVLALEDIFFYQNFKSAIRLGEARSAVILAAVSEGLEFFEYLPTRVKESICGNGRASKVQIQHMVKNLLRFKELPEEDAADALGVAICHFHSTPRPRVQKVRAAHV